MQRDSIANTFLVAVVLCAVCGALVSGSAVALRPMHRAPFWQFVQCCSRRLAMHKLPKGGTADDADQWPNFGDTPEV